MRLKKVKGAASLIESSPYIILNPKEYRGNYETLFPKKQKLQIEIGMGKGDFLIEQSLKHPEINFIGIEKFDSVLVRAIQKLEGLEIPNLKLIRMDAEEISSVFSHEVDTIYLNFSDPWPKKRHAKRRLTSEYFLKKYDSLFAGKNKIIMKTDNAHLFEFSILSFSAMGYQIKEISLDLYKEEELLRENIPTEYETRFVKKGMPIYYLFASKK